MQKSSRLHTTRETLRTSVGGDLADVTFLGELKADPWMGDAVTDNCSQPVLPSIHR